MTAPAIRFGYTPSIHLLPLIYPLLAGWVYAAGQNLDLLPLPAPDLEVALREGSLDGALLDPPAYARLRHMLEVMPGIGLSSEGANGMAVLRSRTRPDLLDGATVAFSPAEAGGVAPALLSALAEPFFGVYLKPIPEAEVAVDPPAAWLLAGDDALRARLPWLLYEAGFSPSALAAGLRPAPTAPDPALLGYAEDLGAAWWVLNGTPMVWALGVLRRELLGSPEAVVAVVRAFQESRVVAREQAETVLDAASKQAVVSEAVVSAIFDRQSVELDASAQGGLAAFYRRLSR